MSSWSSFLQSFSSDSASPSEYSFSRKLACLRLAEVLFFLGVRMPNSADLRPERTGVSTEPLPEDFSGVRSANRFWQVGFRASVRRWATTFSFGVVRWKFEMSSMLAVVVGVRTLPVTTFRAEAGSSKLESAVSLSSSIVASTDRTTEQDALIEWYEL
uniref:(northern house mosquito) hypothetical protein n=1 Tax=Culex pipiens TaxID=7175 RepID=A0A8D8JI93_CULPI